MSSHTLYIALGSNMLTAPRVLEWARRKMRAMFGLLRASKPVWTEPIDYPYPFLFLNQVVEITTERPLAVLRVLLKTLEEEMMARKSVTEEGRRIIDIDLLAFDGEVLRPDDWQRPYVQEGVAEINAMKSRRR